MLQTLMSNCQDLLGPKRNLQCTVWFRCVPSCLPDQTPAFGEGFAAGGPENCMLFTDDHRWTLKKINENKIKWDIIIFNMHKSFFGSATNPDEGVSMIFLSKTIQNPYPVLPSCLESPMSRSGLRPRKTRTLQDVAFPRADRLTDWTDPRTAVASSSFGLPLDLSLHDSSTSRRRG